MKYISILPLALFVPACGFAAFDLVDNFDAYVQGELSGQGGWATDVVGRWSVAAAPSGGIGNAASGSSATGSAAAYKALATPIPDSSAAATYFFRIYRDGPVNISSGLSDDVIPALFGAYEAQINAQHNTAPDDSLKVRDAGAFDDLGPGTFALATWYNVWMIVNNSTDTYELYYDAGIFGTPASALTHVADPNGGAGDFTFGFRNGAAANPLITALLAMGGTTPALTGNFLVDDIYIDLAGQNLANPTVPEPTAAAFLGGAALMGLLRRHRHA